MALSFYPSSWPLSFRNYSISEKLSGRVIRVGSCTKQLISSWKSNWHSWGWKILHIIYIQLFGCIDFCLMVLYPHPSPTHQLQLKTNFKKRKEKKKLDLRKRKRKIMLQVFLILIWGNWGYNWFGCHLPHILIPCGTGCCLLGSDGPTVPPSGRDKVSHPFSFSIQGMSWKHKPLINTGEITVVRV